MEDQVLSIEQVIELQKLGFNVRKYSSMQFYNGNLFFIEDTIMIARSTKIYPTMTIGDIFKVLPTTIYHKEKYAVQFILEKTFHGYVIKYDNIHNSLRETVGIPFSIYKEKFIDALFETLKWCIINKHIDIN